MSRRTKIIITLGPATEAEETIGQLIDRGTNVFRLNMSHAKHDWAREMTRRVRRAASERASCRLTAAIHCGNATLSSASNSGSR